MTTNRLPTIFFGHGSPMNALEDNVCTREWTRIGGLLGAPKAILVISAHWYTRGTAVTAMERPPTIHDFGAFPQALFDVRYPAPGSPELAKRVAEVLAPLPVIQDQKWGLDHGTWSVLVKAFPKADIPVVQLSMDGTQPGAHHFEVGRRLAALRDEGVLIVGTGNVVHNLGRMNWDPSTPPYPWAARFNDLVKQCIASDTPQPMIDFQKAGPDAAASIPSPDHFLPFLYVLGTRQPGDAVTLVNDRVEHGSLSMLTVAFGDLAA
ncbi:4,5-DOPA dioxygenase extradiol [Nitrospirillum sp. BR 11163]|uniref:4,5-DOPA-extradiol-dioxygenase n=1 Tax=Nitrospirillum sp. BR 11163 TaxID=3104323 RepID=UPI002AFE031A|nr:4,5-DOPA dioxygenase extradiol [Nitrospirillum sp. BR 11163]MEA1672121.1 4,5-DOPA dioxygenase extradiol [Nitrospirillum sp. BR 11163]